MTDGKKEGVGEKTIDEEERTEGESSSFSGAIEKVVLFVTDHNGKECVVSLSTNQGNMPLVAVDQVHFRACAAAAQKMANSSGKSIRAVEFSTRKEIQRFEKQMVIVPKFKGPVKLV